MSMIKDLWNHMFRTMDEFGMVDHRSEEVIAFATGLRDGEDHQRVNRYSEDTCLQGFYNQGYQHGDNGLDSQGRKIRGF